MERRGYRDLLQHRRDLPLLSGSPPHPHETRTLMTKAIGLPAALLAVLGLAPALHAADDWTGFSVGANLGYGQYTATWEDIDGDWHEGSLDFTKESALIGISAGYDRQF